MDRVGIRRINMLASALLALILILASAAFSDQAHADGEALPSATVEGIWIVPEYISGPRQPASGGMFAWTAYGYYVSDSGLQDDLLAEDFVLQMKPWGGEWADFKGNNPKGNIVILGGDDMYIDRSEAIVAAAVPDNKDPFIKKWRVVYRPDTPDAKEVVSEVIVQGASLEQDSDIRVVDPYTCFNYNVEKAPWSYEAYRSDHIPPIYIAYADQDAVIHIDDNGLIPDTAKEHRIYPNGSWGSMKLTQDGINFTDEDLSQIDTGLYLGDLDDNAGGIAGLADYWDTMKELGVLPSDIEVPDAEALADRIGAVSLTLDENTDEYLRGLEKGSTVFWVSGAGTKENIARGVSDYILVVIREMNAQGVVRHDWDEPEWKWVGSDAEGYEGARVTFRCRRSDGKAVTVEADVTSSVSGANTIFTATAYLSGQKYTAEKIVKTSDLKKTSEQGQDSGKSGNGQASAGKTSGGSQSAGGNTGGKQASAGNTQGSKQSDANKAAREKAAREKAAVRKAEAKAKKVKTVTVNAKTVNKKAIDKAVKKAGGSSKYVTKIILGKKAAKISKNAFKTYKKVRTIEVRSKKLKKASVKNSLKGSKVRTIKVNVGNKKINKKYVKKYKKFFTKKNAGRKAGVK